MKSLLVGQVLYGFCGGTFGRDSYSDKRIEAVGADWVVVRESSSQQPNFASGPDIHRELIEYTKEEHKVE